MKETELEVIRVPKLRAALIQAREDMVTANVAWRDAVKDPLSGGETMRALRFAMYQAIDRYIELAEKEGLLVKRTVEGA